MASRMEDFQTQLDTMQGTMSGKLAELQSQMDSMDLRLPLRQILVPSLNQPMFERQCKICPMRYQQAAMRVPKM